jgi:hypothetical protein
MSLKLRAPSRPLWSALVRASLLGAVLVGLAAFANMACEDKAIGRPCDILADAGQTQAVYNNQALECPSRICLKPVRAETVNRDVDTGAYCSAECSKDSDCDGQRRDSKDSTDKRCESGYACGVAFVVGPLCCKKLCICKDFLPQGVAITVPLTCDKGLNGGHTACAENP